MDDKRYTLMNKNRPVLDFLYNLDTHHVVKILKRRELDFAPPAILDMKGNPTRAALDGWWLRRAIPASRAQIQRLIAELHVDSTLALAEKNFGLSLSDRYWINDPENPQNWDDINFFDNDFTEDLGLLTLGQDSSSDNPNLMSPNSTVGGDLNKKWTILNGVRMLVKSGTGFVNQEVYNEVIATHLHKRLLMDTDYVPYSLHQEGKRTYCACPNMLHEDEEFIPAIDIVQNHKKPDSLDEAQFLTCCFERLGFEKAESFSFVMKVFACDHILGKPGRDLQSFGVIRNVESLAYTRFAPIFGTGNSLWCNVESLDFPQVDKRTISIYDFQQTLLVGFEWFEPDKLDGFTDEVRSILSHNPNMPPARIESIIRGIDCRWQPQRFR